ncbi:penicillin-insensitive murein endopeptidase [Lentilitoribacter sp. EG35]|jgi:penicillin-insensitive murein endopeptidase|uniref:penicillin-insensitive murein endopeptidase n=1 Tax=Lentilitoribacter sp. EG35 TaxID=3234192 RepID=UPI00345F40E8
MKLQKIHKFLSICMGLSLLFGSSIARAETKPAKVLFGSEELPSVQTANPYGFYTKGCIAGAVAMPIDGPTWQAMRLERNRRWGHPELISLVQDLSKEAAAKDGWPGLLVGDISQPRGGPMLSGHASHQVGLDADIWLTPMPNRRLTYQERTQKSAISVLKKNTLKVDKSIWTQAHANLIMRAASYPNVERLFVHPGIKKELCDNWKGDRSNLNKVRPYYGHHYHFHIRLKCPAGSVGCKSQARVPNDDSCGAPLAWWFESARWAPPKPAKPGKKPRKRIEKTLADLPQACTTVLNANGPSSEADVTLGKMVYSDVKLNYSGRPNFRTLTNIPIPVAK